MAPELFVSTRLKTRSNDCCSTSRPARRTAFSASCFATDALGGLGAGLRPGRTAALLVVGAGEGEEGRGGLLLCVCCSAGTATSSIRESEAARRSQCHSRSPAGCGCRYLRRATAHATRARSVAAAASNEGGRLRPHA